MNLYEFRKNYPVKPGQIVRYMGKKVEIISYPWEETNGTIVVLIRTKPDDPTTMQQIQYKYLDIKPWLQINWPINDRDVLGIKMGTFYIDFFINPFFGTYFSFLKNNQKLRFRLRFLKFWKLMPDRSNSYP